MTLESRIPNQHHKRPNLSNAGEFLAPGSGKSSLSLSLSPLINNISANAKFYRAHTGGKFRRLKSEETSCLTPSPERREINPTGTSRGHRRFLSLSLSLPPSLLKPTPAWRSLAPPPRGRRGRRRRRGRSAATSSIPYPRRPRYDRPRRRRRRPRLPPPSRPEDPPAPFSNLDRNGE